MNPAPAPSDPGMTRDQAWDIPETEITDVHTDLTSLARHLPPEGGAWLWVTLADGVEGAALDGIFLPRREPAAHGGDVLIRVDLAGDGPEPAVTAQVWAVVAGRMIPVAAPCQAPAGQWPEKIRNAAVFAFGALAELERLGADTQTMTPVGVSAASADPACLFPELQARVLG